LDKINATGSKKAFSAIALKAQLKEDLICRALHGDITPRLLYGAYEDGETYNLALELTRAAFVRGRWEKVGKLFL